MASTQRSLTHRAPFADHGSHPISQSTAQRIIDKSLSQGGDYADLFFEYHVSAGYGYEDGILKSVARAAGVGLGIRVRHGDATGYAYTEDLSEEAMSRTAMTAAQIAQTSRGAQARPLRVVPIPNRYPVDMPTIDLDGKTKRSLLERSDRCARAYDPRIVRVEASLSEEITETLIANSEGAWCYDSRPLIRFGLRVIAESKGKRESGSSGGGGRVDMGYFEKYSPESHARIACEQALTMLEARPAPAGVFPVVLGPADSGILLHEAVGHGLEADFNRKKTSNYTDRLGQAVASPLCTIVDDATWFGGRGSVNVDDEGEIPHCTTLIEKGVLVGYMHDKHSAKFFGVKATGNGRRESYRSHPMPRMTNTLLLRGADAPEDIIKSVSFGIYAKRFGGGQVDISNGDFVFSLTEGYLIENGRITAPIKGVNLIGNGPEVMRKVDMLGHDFEMSDGMWTCGKDGQSVPVGVGCPTIRIAEMTVGGTEHNG